MAVLAHPDDESLGIGGTLAKYASAGVETYLLTATRGDGGRYGAHRPGDAGTPGAPRSGAFARTNCARRRRCSVCVTWRCSSIAMGSSIARNAKEAIAAIVEHLRRVQPDVVITFGQDGAYGHPDHIAISQLTTAAIVAAREPAISKLYYIAWPESTWAAYQSAFKKLTSTVDGVERRVVPWPDWRSRPYSIRARSAAPCGRRLPAINHRWRPTSS